VQNWRLRKKEIGVEIKCIEKRCTRQPVLTAERNVTFPSSQTAPDQYTAESATQNEDHQDGSRLRLTLRRYKLSFSFLSQSSFEGLF